MQFTRAICERKAKEPGNPGDPVIFTASTPGVKRDGRDLNIASWDLNNYQENPVFLWVHDYGGRTLPIGRADASIEGKRMRAVVIFDQADEFARQVEQKYRTGFLNAVSVGWDDHVYCKKCGNELDRWSQYGLEYFRKKCPHCEAELTPEVIDLRYELLDISGVPVPGDPDALIERQIRALKQTLEDITPELVGAEGEWEELAAEMAGLFVPAPEESDDERKRRYQALLPKYRRMGKVPPEFRTVEELEALSAEEIRGLFLEGEVATTNNTNSTNVRVGAVLNARNRGELEQAVALIQGVLARAVKEEEQSEDGRAVDQGQPISDVTDESVLLAIKARLSNTFINYSGGLK